MEKLTNEYKTPTLPSFVVNSQRKRDNEAKLSGLAIEMSNAYNTLRGMPDLRYALPQNINEINQDWLSGEIERRQKGIKKLPLPQGDKAELMEKWDGIGVTAQPYVTSISSFFEAYPDAKVVINNDDTVSLANFEEVSADFGKIEVPALAQEHFNRFCALKHALKELRDFEAENGIYSFSLGEFLPKTSSPQFFAEVWASGNFLKLQGDYVKCRDTERDMARAKSLCMSEGRQYEF